MFQAKFAADGEHLLYSAPVNDQLQLFGDTFPVPSHRVQVTREGVGSPPSADQFWATGSEIFYVTPGAGSLRALPYSIAKGEWTMGSPRTLFELPKGTAIAPQGDGSRFLSTWYLGAARPPTIAIVQNWQRLVPR
jgi:hypothetical protein